MPLLTPEQKQQFSNWCIDRADELKAAGTDKYPHAALHMQACDELGFEVTYVTLNRKFKALGIKPNRTKPPGAHGSTMQELESRINALEHQVQALAKVTNLTFGS